VSPRKYTGKLIWTSILIGILLLINLVAGAASLWKADNYNFFHDTRKHKIGDLVTVIVLEKTEASQNAQSSGSKDGSVSVAPGGGLLNFIPLISASGELEHNASGSTSKDNRFQTSITVKVVEVLENGVLKIEGKRSIKIDGEHQEVLITGYVREEDITVNNTILSTYIADAEIHLLGSGAINNKTTPGLLTRLLEWVF
jgi:flagellar L-ring protein precursor FlgH